MARPPREKESALYSLHCRVGKSDYEAFLGIVNRQGSNPSSYIRKLIKKKVLEELKP